MDYELLLKEVITISKEAGLKILDIYNDNEKFKNISFKNDNSPLDSNVSKFNLNKYSKNYLNHLFNTNEILA